MDKSERDREAALVRALSDPTSEYYQHMNRMLEEATALSRTAKAASSYTTIPFEVSDSDLTALEAQFNVSLRKRGAVMRSRHTERVAALLYVLEAAMLEIAGSGGRTVLMVDGDLLSMAALGIEGRLVERTDCHSRAAYGYFQEDEHMVRATYSKTAAYAASASTLLEEINAGGGEHFHPKLREKGPVVDSVVINHFKTPVGLAQAAWLISCRGGVGYGVFPFQMDMLERESGRLHCFPGTYYVDKAVDVITLVPDADATMSISHPYSQLLEFVNNNGVSVLGKEFLCEKYMTVKGIMYYTLVPVDKDYEAPEILRTHYFDPEQAQTVKIHYPRVRMSSEGVPVGFERGCVVMLKKRLDKVIARVADSRNDVVRPQEVFTAMMDYNNMTVNTLDSATTSERMNEFEENEVSVAIALLVNWRRHAARGTLNTLLHAVKLRHSVKDVWVMKFASLALAAWWTSPKVGSETMAEIPFPSVVDWCGNDFSVVIENVDPWVEVAQSTFSCNERNSVQHPWFPLIPSRDSKWYGEIKSRMGKRRVVDEEQSSGVGVKRNKGTSVRKGLNVGYSAPSTACDNSRAVDVVVKYGHEPRQSSSILSRVKASLYPKLVSEQGAVRESNPGITTETIEGYVPSSIPVVPVPDVDPISSIRDDMNMILGGLPEMDASGIGYRLAEVDIDKITRGNIEINDSKRLIPKSRYVRKPKVDLGVEGSRPQSSAALLGAVFKRNVGIPSNRGVVNLDLTPDWVVQRLVDTCFKENWKEIVNRHVSTGMWEPNEEDIFDYMGRLEETKAKKMLDEFFVEGNIELDRWKLMAKGKIKAKREPDCDSQITHSQTIMFLESSCTNAMYSSITRRVNACVAECLRPNIKLNPQWSDEESEDWYNSIEPLRKSTGRTYSYSSDSKDYDRSQEHPCLRVEASFFRILGFDGDRFSKWCEEWGLKRAMNVAFGIVFSNVLGGISGDWKTLFRNGLIQLAANVVSADLRRDDIVTLEIKGDDMDGEFARPIAVETAVEKMSLTFNLASKFNTNSVRYFCKKFRLKILGRWVEVADPWARAQSLCTPIWIDSCDVSLMEKWISLCVDLRHYDNEVVIEKLAYATQQYYELKAPPFGLCRGLSAMKADSGRFMSFFEAPVLVS